MTLSELRAAMTAYRREVEYYTRVEPDEAQAAWYQAQYDEAKAELHQRLKLLEGK